MTEKQFSSIRDKAGNVFTPKEGKLYVHDVGFWVEDGKKSASIFFQYLSKNGERFEYEGSKDMSVINRYLPEGEVYGTGSICTSSGETVETRSMSRDGDALVFYSFDNAEGWNLNSSDFHLEVSDEAKEVK